jgi:hypothetical protein
MYAYEVGRFVPDGRNETWWLNSRVPCFEDDPNLSKPVARPILYLQVRGELIKKGDVTPGGYTHELNVHEVISCRRVTDDERTPFEF